MSAFSKPPHAVKGDLKPFTFSVSKEEIDDLNALLRRPLPRPTWENSGNHGQNFGVTREWLASAVAEWQSYDWQRLQERINAVPHFTLPVHDGVETTVVHFAALFSPNPDATPIILPHGWPGSFIEFLPLLTQVQAAHASDPSSLAYHLIVPDLPGYIFTPVSTSRGVSHAVAAGVLHSLMLALGFSSAAGGYIAQGGDVGAGVSRYMVLSYDECRGALLNMLPMSPPGNRDELAPPTETELISLRRGEEVWSKGGLGYAVIQGERPSTIGLALATSPQALLAWIGEKMIQWSHEPPAMEDILANVSLYWLTGCYPSSIWTYRNVFGPSASSLDESFSIAQVKKPLGFSHFPYEIAAPPKSWAEATGRVSFFRHHDKGGHFAALEQPDELWKDIVEFVDHVKASER